MIPCENFPPPKVFVILSRFKKACNFSDKLCTFPERNYFAGWLEQDFDELQLDPAPARNPRHPPRPSKVAPPEIFGTQLEQGGLQESQFRREAVLHVR